MKEENKIVANTSKAYGYNYAALSDIAKQGFTIPKMKTGTEGEREYVYYFDTEINEWIRGAEIVIPENIISKDGKNKMNKAQLYGSALTYARRYTCLLALQLACDDDKKIEAQKDSVFDEPTDAQIKTLADEFRELFSKEEQVRILNGLKKTEAEQIGYNDLVKYVNFKKNEIKANEGKGNKPGN